MTTTPAGLVSRESMRELRQAIRRLMSVAISYGEVSPYGSRAEQRMFVELEAEQKKVDALLEALSSPAIGVSDAMVQAALDTFGMPPSFHAMKKALRAALRPSGEDRG